MTPLVCALIKEFDGRYAYEVSWGRFGGESPAHPGHPSLTYVILGPATTQNLIVKFDGEICGGALGGKCF